MKSHLLNGDVMRIPLADQSVHCIITSPPYWGLRDYGTGQWVGGLEDCDHIDPRPVSSTYKTTNDKRDDKALELFGRQYKNDCQKCGARRVDKQLGSESLHDCGAWVGRQVIETDAVLLGGPCGECFVCNVRAYAREFWRILRDDGTLWLNLGDSYAQSTIRHRGGAAGGNRNRLINNNFSTIGAGLKPKDLCGIPWRVALALQSDGWYLRSDIIWAKPNPMPESVTDRPSKSHEYIFLLTKSKRYFYDADAVREKQKEPSRGFGEVEKNNWSVMGKRGSTETIRLYNPAGRNRRTVWNIATAPYSGAHFATFPPKLVEPMVKAGTSERGVCPDCGAQWKREIEVKGGSIGKSWHDHSNDAVSGQLVKDKRAKGGNYYRRRSCGFLPTCDHYDDLYRREFPRARSARKRYQRKISGDWFRRVRKRPGLDHWLTIPATVFDPFSGSGTTVQVAERLGRRGVGLDLSLDYIELAKDRTGLAAWDQWESGIDATEEVDLGPMFEGII